MSMTKFGISRSEYEISDIDGSNKTLNRNFLKMSTMVSHNRKLVNRNTKKMLTKDGASEMEGNLKMGDNRIVHLADSTGLNDAVNRKQLLAVGAEAIQTAHTEAEKAYLILDGTKSMEG